ncbi:hypothetical protein GSI_09072 [Ganoderma sinense ZZ0214-1]|uniref:Protein kinase domain-containing protein n=1 Tax=Ganoderma sinense ZZ0214-1 TaxID=1077348 RepID=A0A2G8S5L0_9APHY|nr:hypothetical protein GSI_09072 [Ganoderma sinense ZZ0214-1]
MVTSKPSLSQASPYGPQPTYEEYYTLQKTHDSRSGSALTFYAIHYADLASLSAQSASSSKSNPPPEDRFFIKVAPRVKDEQAGKALKQKLLNEASYYQNHLSSVQGNAVPIHYGVWKGRTEWGSDMAISIMQWGGVPYLGQIKGTEGDGEEVRKAVLKAFHTLHMQAKMSRSRLPIENALIRDICIYAT